MTTSITELDTLELDALEAAILTMAVKAEIVRMKNLQRETLSAEIKQVYEERIITAEELLALIRKGSIRKVDNPANAG